MRKRLKRQRLYLKRPSTKLNKRTQELLEQKQPLRETLEETVADEIPYDYLKSILTNFSKILPESTSREQQKKLLHMLISEITIYEQREIESINLKINDSG
jgi:site-specific DNA recombinase